MLIHVLNRLKNNEKNLSVTDFFFLNLITGIFIASPKSFVFCWKNFALLYLYSPPDSYTLLFWYFPFNPSSLKCLKILEKCLNVFKFSHKILYPSILHPVASWNPGNCHYFEKFFIYFRPGLEYLPLNFISSLIFKKTVHCHLIKSFPY